MSLNFDYISNLSLIRRFHAIFGIIINDCVSAVGVGGVVECAASFIT
jgi:hypothetical protein